MISLLQSTLGLESCIVEMVLKEHAALKEHTRFAEEMLTSRHCEERSKRQKTFKIY